MSLSPQARPGVPPHHGSAETSVPLRAEVLQLLLPLPQVGGDHGGREAAGESIHPSVCLSVSLSIEGQIAVARDAIIKLLHNILARGLLHT